MSATAAPARTPTRDDDAATHVPPIGRRLVGLGLIVACVGLLVVALPGLGEVRTAFSHAKPVWLVVTALLELGSVLAFVVAFRGIYCRRIPWRLSYRIGVAEQGTNVLLPTGGAGGLALGAWALARAGMDTERVARRSVAFFVLTSGVNFAAAIVVGLLLTVGVLPGDVALGWKVGPALAAIVVIGVVCLTPRFLRAHPVEEREHAGRVRRLLAKGGDALGAGISDAGMLLREHRLWVIVGSVGYMGFDAAALWAAFHALGGSPEGSTFLLAYVVGQLGGLIPLPGGPRRHGRRPRRLARPLRHARRGRHRLRPGLPPLPARLPGDPRCPGDGLPPPRPGRGPGRRLQLVQRSGSPSVISGMDRRVRTFGESAARPGRTRGAVAGRCGRRGARTWQRTSGTVH